MLADRKSSSCNPMLERLGSVCWVMVGPSEKVSTSLEELWPFFPFQDLLLGAQSSQERLKATVCFLEDVNTEQGGECSPGSAGQRELPLKCTSSLPGFPGWALHDGLRDS